MSLIRQVVLTVRAKRDLRTMPRHIADKLELWMRSVELMGLAQVRRISGFHDEPLKGKRSGQRSIRLNQAYRAIYVVKGDAVEFVSVEEVTKHEY